MEHILKRDVQATRIPSGEAVTLPIGSELQITQTLGGNITVRLDSGLFRIAAADADALSDYVPEPGAASADTPSADTASFSADAVWAALRGCFDPEIPVNIVDLGLVYDLSIEKTENGQHRVEVKMTLTAPGCGMGPVIAEDARRLIAALPTVEDVKVHIVWDPIWTPQMISDQGRKKLGLE
ncbi:FeS assembly SUF system protein SufT [Cephaloticoccus primus]|uniref:FeS assembly SUF system protein SufT n=1 Tax=Cephaloticoccus primus TaxID=1548207 RepID=A0A139SPW5_9BACT|nr:putative Fe-S cluster assembly protein SufT [Cephaloticoccus primus]KXU36655.1 FeS assembly SUF system protein SufT [Cephaloticoccus primus]